MGGLPVALLSRHGGQKVTVTGVENRKNTTHMLAYPYHAKTQVEAYNVAAAYSQSAPNHTYPTRKSLPAAVPRAMFEPW